VNDSDDGAPTMHLHDRGLQVLDDPRTNRGTAFTPRERGHHDLLPPGVESIDDRVARCHDRCSDIDGDIGRRLPVTAARLRRGPRLMGVYALIAAGGVLVLGVPPQILHRYRRPSWGIDRC
jgi:hypothetical protein